jgi:hypothetical protein
LYLVLDTLELWLQLSIESMLIDDKEGWIQVRKIRNPVIYIALIFAAYLYLLTGCGNYEPPEFPPIDYYLVITDSIGVEMGEDCYMFRWPVDATHSPDGDIAVLDKLKHCVLLYTSEGEFIRTIGREGEGPGEFHMPSSIEFRSDGSLLIQDREIATYDQYYDYQDQMTWPRYPPYLVEALDDGGFVGNQGMFLPGEHGVVLTSTIGRWDIDDSLSV